MKKLRLDFKNRIVSIVSDQKTVVAYMDEKLRKRDFLHFFPKESAHECTDNITFDFENKVICLKKPVRHSGEPKAGSGGYKCIKQIPVPAIREELKHILDMIGWNE